MTEAIRNGLYSITTTLLDGVHGGQTGVSVLRNGTMLGGGSVLYHFGRYHCSGGKWKGEVTSQEHSPTIDVRPFAGYIAIAKTVACRRPRRSISIRCRAARI